MSNVDPTISEDHLNAEAIDAEPALNPSLSATRLSGTDADKEVDGPDDAPDGSVFVERPMFNALDGTRGRAGGVYLDMVERAQAEELRAKSEGREPDYDNPPATTGTQLVVEAQRVDNIYSNPASDPVAPVKEVDPVSTAAVDVGIAPANVDTDTLEQHLAEAQARDEFTPNPDATTAETGSVPEQGNYSSDTGTTDLGSQNNY